MPNIEGSASAIQRKNLELPLDGNGRRHETSGFVAGLIFKLSRDVEDLAVFSKRSPKF